MAAAIAQAALHKSRDTDKHASQKKRKRQRKVHKIMTSRDFLEYCDIQGLDVGLERNHCSMKHLLNAFLEERRKRQGKESNVSPSLGNDEAEIGEGKRGERSDTEKTRTYTRTPVSPLPLPLETHSPARHPSSQSATTGSLTLSRTKSVKASPTPPPFPSYMRFPGLSERTSYPLPSPFEISPSKHQFPFPPPNASPIPVCALCETKLKDGGIAMPSLLHNGVRESRRPSSAPGTPDKYLNQNEQQEGKDPKTLRFCSWSCMKTKASQFAPVHRRYEKTMLVGMAREGYSVLSRIKAGGSVDYSAATIGTTTTCTMDPDPEWDGHLNGEGEDEDAADLVNERDIII